MTCSTLAAERGEPMLGSAFTQGGVLLVEQPGAWGHAGLAESDFDSEVALALGARADAAGLRLLAVRRPGRSAPSRRAWAVKLPGEAALRWSSYAEDAELLEVPLDWSSDALADTEPTYLVCAHGKRDRCCALLGRPVAAELERLRPGRVWECSHTGGHRFAPIVLAVPSNVAGAALYGRLEVADLPSVVTATGLGRTVPTRLRGIIGHPPAAQAAIVTAQLETGVSGLGDWTAVDQGDQWRLSGPDLAAEVVVAETVEDQPYPSCLKPGPEPQRHYWARGFQLL